MLGSFPPWEELDLLGLSEGRLEFLLWWRPVFTFGSFGSSFTFSSPSLWLSRPPLSSETTSLPWVSFMLRNRGGGVRPDLAERDLWSSTRPPRLDRDSPEAELVRDLKPPPTCRVNIRFIYGGNCLNCLKLSSSYLFWAISFVALFHYLLLVQTLLWLHTNIFYYKHWGTSSNSSLQH